MMQQAHRDMVTVHTDCVNAIHDGLAKHDNGDVDDNDNNHDEYKDVEAQVIDDNMQQTTNATTEPPCLAIRLTTTETTTNMRI
jgi:hypothetical protein